MGVAGSRELKVGGGVTSGTGDIRSVDADVLGRERVVRAQATAAQDVGVATVPVATATDNEGTTGGLNNTPEILGVKTGVTKSRVNVAANCSTGVVVRTRTTDFKVSTGGHSGSPIRVTGKNPTHATTDRGGAPTEGVPVNVSVIKGKARSAVRVHVDFNAGQVDAHDPETSAGALVLGEIDSSGCASPVNTGVSLVGVGAGIVGVIPVDVHGQGTGHGGRTVVDVHSVDRVALFVSAKGRGSAGQLPFVNPLRTTLVELAGPVDTVSSVVVDDVGASVGGRTVGAGPSAGSDVIDAGVLRRTVDALGLSGLHGLLGASGHGQEAHTSCSQEDTIKVTFHVLPKPIF